jgi:hypothetical protein
LTHQTLSAVEVFIIEAEQMELFAIVVLGLSAIAGFSTSARKPNYEVDPRSKEDPDWAFTQSEDSSDSSDRE